MSLLCMQDRCQLQILIACQCPWLLSFLFAVLLLTDLMLPVTLSCWATI